MNRTLFLAFLAFTFAVLTGCASSGDIPGDVGFVGKASLLAREVTGADLIAPEACEGGAVANRNVQAKADSNTTRSTQSGVDSLVTIKASKTQVCASGPATTVPEKRVVSPASAASAAAAKKKQ